MKITQQKLADAAGISRMSVHNKMAGKSEWKLSEIEKICKALPVRYEYKTNQFIIIENGGAGE